MRKLFVTLFVVICGCAGGGTSWHDDYRDADTYNYSKFNGKTIKSIKYCDNCGAAGDLLQITFTDGKTMQIYAYKYVMEIHK